MFSLVAKIQKVSANELLFRTKLVAYKLYDKVKHSIIRSDMTDARFLECLDQNTIPEIYSTNRELENLEEVSEKLLNFMRNRKNVKFFIDRQRKADFIEIICKYFPDIVTKAAKAAEDVCNHKFSFLGINIKYNEDVLWTTDPVSLEPWPTIFYDDIDFFGGNSDIKHVWELNRHQYFVDLGKAYWLIGNEKYAQKFVRLIKSWIHSNPFKMGVNWISSLELAFRSISWIWTYYFCLDSKSLDAQTHLEILKSLYQHGEYIEKHLSFYISPYNHLIGEATALFFIGTLFPEFNKAKKWKEKGLKILETEIENQFYSGGGTVEQATFYHHATLGFYLLAVLLKKINSEEVSSKMWSMIEKAIEFTMYITKPDGKVPMIGDADDGRSIRIDNLPFWDFRAFLSIGAVLFSRGDMKKLSGGFAEDSLWLLGVRGLEKYKTLEEVNPPKTSIAFYSSGYYIMRSDWTKDAHYLCFDCGEQAAGLHTDAAPSAAHGHADFLSFELTAFGKSILIDSGLYSYNDAISWRDYFRKTQAHNTVVVDGKDQSKHLGNMTWSHVARANLKRWISSGLFDYVEGNHNGYTKSDKPVIHNRTVFFKRNEYWIVRDFLEGEGEHSIESYFHFSPTELNIESNSNSISTQNKDSKNILIQPVDKELNMEVISEGNDNPSSGWIATSYGCKAKAPILKYSNKVILPIDITIIIIPFRNTSKPSIITEKLNILFKQKKLSNTATAFKIRFDDHTDYYLFSNPHNKTVAFDKFTTDGRTVFVRAIRGGKIYEVSIIRGSFLAAEGKQLVELEKPVDFLNVSHIGDKSEIELSEDIDYKITL